MTIVNWRHSGGNIFFGKAFPALGNHMYFWQSLQTSPVGSTQPRKDCTKKQLTFQLQFQGLANLAGLTTSCGLAAGTTDASQVASHKTSLETQEKEPFQLLRPPLPAHRPTAHCSASSWEDPGWGFPWIPSGDTVGSSRGCGGRQGTRRWAAAAAGSAGRGSCRAGRCWGTACGAWRARPNRLRGNTKPALC